MNRRGFIGALLAGVVAPAFLPGAGRGWKKTGELLTPKRSIINPAYFDAPFEVQFIWDENVVHSILYKREALRFSQDGNMLKVANLKGRVIHGPFPPRCLDAAGTQWVSPFLSA